MHNCVYRMLFGLEEERMLFFENDYSEGAHPLVLEKLIKTNMEQLSPYGTDIYSSAAKEKIKAACECPDAEVFFLVGGTQTNKTIIATLLKPYEGVIAADTGHVSLHEAGAIEYTGHKVLQIPQKNGKIEAHVLEAYVKNFYADENHEHMVFPGMVYISHPTEYGTLYSKKELEDLSVICKKYDLPLYMDGARLGYGLTSARTDVTLADVAKYCDVFYIGGTKVGALCGEAVVFTKKAPKYFMTMVKQHGAMLAKGRLTGIQFDALFTDNLYFEISKHANDMADLLKAAFKEKGYEFFIDSPTNQIFIKLEDERVEELKKHVRISFWEKAGDKHTVVRFATSWATGRDSVEELISLL